MTLSLNSGPTVPDVDEEFVQIINVSKKFGEAAAVQNVDLRIKKGDLFALLGSSGCGKSTLLRMLAGFETASAGKIVLDGENLAGVPPYRRPVNMMFQSYALFPHITVAENIAFGLKQEKICRDEIASRVDAMLDLVQMRRFASRYSHQLSGGQQQRVALARSLVKQPKLLLLDEPLSALDKQIRQKTQIELVDILDKVGVTCIMVTHDQEEAMAIADRLAIMHEGQIIQVGTPFEVYEYPNSEFCARFVGSTNLFSGTIVEDESDHVVVASDELPVPFYISHGVTGQQGMTMAVSLRPERVILSEIQPEIGHNWAAGKVDKIVYMGSYTLYHVLLDSGRLMVAHVPSSAFSGALPPTYDDQVYLSWDTEAARVLSK